jgi:hypothetical protein
MPGGGKLAKGSTGSREVERARARARWTSSSGGQPRGTRKARRRAWQSGWGSRSPGSSPAPCSAPSRVVAAGSVRRRGRGRSRVRGSSQIAAISTYTAIIDGVLVENDRGSVEGAATRALAGAPRQSHLDQATTLAISPLRNDAVARTDERESIAELWARPPHSDRCLERFSQRRVGARQPHSISQADARYIVASRSAALRRGRERDQNQNCCPIRDSTCIPSRVHRLRLPSPLVHVEGRRTRRGREHPHTRPDHRRRGALGEGSEGCSLASTTTARNRARARS